MFRMGSVALAAVLAAGAAQAAERPKPEPVRETLFGHALDDPYRWMEAPSRAADWTGWVKASSAETVARLGALPGRAALLAKMKAADEAGVRYTDPHAHGARVFARRLDPGAQQPKLIVRDGTGPERVLLDPEAAGKGVAINSYNVSPDGRTVAVQTSSGGAEIGAIRFLDADTGQAIPGEIGPIWGEFEPMWLDGRTMAITRLDAAAVKADPFQNMRAVLYRIGDKAEGAALLGAGVAGAPDMAPSVFPILQNSPASDWTFAYGANARADALVFVAPTASVAAGRPAWTQTAGYEDRVVNATLFGDALYAVSNRDAPMGKVLRLALPAKGPLAGAEVVLPEGEVVVTQVAAGKDGVYVAGQRDGLARLFFLPGGRGPAKEVALPLKGSMSFFASADDGEGVTFGLADWFTPRRAFRVHNGTVSSLGLDSQGYKGAAAFVERREEATSADGTKVPLAILMRRDLGARPNAPVMLEGYAGYGISTAEPFYNSLSFGFLETGGVMAYCGTRGGGERGRAWHEGGREANKPNAHADLIACGERLAQLGISSPGRMTIEGGSAGGLLIAPTGLKRPDLFRSAVVAVGIVNPTRLAAAPNGANQFGEMGDPNTEAGFNALLSQDGYQMLATAKDMPDTLLTIGLNDNRVTPWMSAKYAARALDRFEGRRKLMIRADAEQGHGIGSGRDLRINEYADIYSFVFSEAGAPGFEAER